MNIDVIELSRRWRMGSEIGSGGFAKVYSATSMEGEDAVVKLIPKQPGAGRELLFEELGDEPNILPVIDHGEHGDSWVLVMPRAEKSLREHLVQHENVLPLAEVVHILTDIATALASIEDRVVHRDLKPENILLWETNWCLADFGIARYAAATTSADTRKFSMTSRYAAPEQWRFERATSRTDVYALGILAYELVAGQRPFSGPREADFRDQHLHNDPSELPRTVPTALQSLITQCLYKAPEARPTPGTVLTRLQTDLNHSLQAVQRLQEANLAVVEQRAEAQRGLSIAETEALRRAELFETAEQALSTIFATLRSQVTAAAPSSAPSGGREWPLIPNEARLYVEEICQASRPSTADRYSLPFDVIAYSTMVLKIPSNRYGYEGRSHSLWYCDAQEEGVFRWYETAFMVSPLIPSRGVMDPFALDPLAEDAVGAVAPIMSGFQVAWPFTPIDQGQEQDFVERWMNWFADAAQGRLDHPRTMPERDPQGSWRRH